jgi:hypothetical protein
VLISERASAEILTSVGISREQARLLLHTGVAGAGERTGTSTLYDESRVREVAARPTVDEHRLAQVCPVGLYVARLARDRSLDTSATWEEQARAVAPQPPLPTMTAAVLGVRHRLAHGRLPWVATVSGFVVFGGEATGWSRSGDGASVVDLERPGRWYRDVAERWFAFGRGRHWCFWDPWRCVTSGPDHGSSGGLATMTPCPPPPPAS